MAKFTKLQKIERERVAAKLAKIDADLDRWLPRLTRAANTVTDLQKKRRRIAKLAAELTAPLPVKPKLDVKPEDVTDIPFSELPIADVLPDDRKLQKAAADSGAFKLGSVKRRRSKPRLAGLERELGRLLTPSR